MIAACDPARADLDVRALHHGPGDAVRGLFLTHVAGICRIGVVERLAIDVLGMIWQVCADKGGTSSFVR